MARKRVHEIAKERGISSKEALEVLRKAGLDVKVAASSVEEEEAVRAFGNGAAAPAPAEDAPAAKSAPAKTKAKAKAEPSEAKADGEGDDGKAAARRSGPPQARPDIRPPEGEPVRRAGPEGRGPRILQDAPPPQERQPSQPQGDRGPRSGGQGGGGRPDAGPRGDR